MADDVQVAERDQVESESSDRHGETSEGPNGASMALPAALALGGAVIGALAAVLGRRRRQDTAAEENARPDLSDDLTSRASAAARGDEDEPELEEVDDEGFESPDASGEARDEEDGDAPDAAAEAEDAEPRAEQDEADRGEDDELPADAEARAHDNGDEGDDQAPPGGPATRVARSAARQLGELTGRDADAVLGVERDGDGWRVTLELVELSRTPSTTDVLGRYDVELDDDGEITEYRQVDRYVRGRGGDSR